MHEREPNRDDEEPRRVFTDCLSEVDDVGHRAAWMEAAEFIADTEEVRAFCFHDPLSRIDPARKSRDRFEPRFLYVGDRESLAFMAETAAGIIKHGKAFAFWVRDMGGKPDALDEFEKVFLGHWKCAEHFTKHVLDERAGEGSKRRDGEESCDDLPADAKSWAHDLQRRGEIRVVLSPQGGVLVFRGW